MRVKFYKEESFEESDITLKIQNTSSYSQSRDSTIHLKNSNSTWVFASKKFHSRLSLSSQSSLSQFMARIKIFNLTEYSCGAIILSPKSINSIQNSTFPQYRWEKRTNRSVCATINLNLIYYCYVEKMQINRSKLREIREFSRRTRMESSLFKG